MEDGGLAAERSLVLDYDRDGTPDEALIDNDFDGEPDTVGKYRNGEDTPYAFEPYAEAKRKR